MQLHYHGVAGDKNVSGSLHFGVQQLAARLYSYRFEGILPEVSERLPDWADRWIDRQFEEDFIKLNDIFWKMDRVAGHFDKTLAAASQHSNFHVDGVRLDSPEAQEFFEFQRAIDDMPLYLDLMIIYLRIHVDLIGRLIPRFYGRSRGGVVPFGFRNQRNWFLKKNQTFDPEYRRILKEKTDWFETLSRENNVGLREARIHGGAIYQVGYALATKTQPFDARIMLWDRTGSKTKDVISTLKEVVAGYFEYLDLSCEHFAGLLAEIGLVNLQQLGKPILTFNGYLASGWLYPTCEP